MRRSFRLSFLLFLLISCGEAPDREVSMKLQEAQAAFLDAAGPDDYLRVAAFYQEVLDTGFVNGAVLFNQGNAFMRAGKPGRAVAAYRRAGRYRARDPYLRANLDLALGERPVARARTLIDHFFFWQEWLSTREKYFAAAAAGGMTLLLGLVRLFSRRSGLLKKLVLAGLALTLLLSASAVLDWVRHDLTRHGVVVIEEVVARKGNAESFAPAFTEPLEEGTEFILREERGDWIRLRLHSGPEGWIRKEAAVLY